MNKLYDDYSDEEIAAMECEFDAWLQWRDAQDEKCRDLISGYDIGLMSEGSVANAQRNTKAPC